MGITFNNTKKNPFCIFRATSGGTVFSANLTGTAAHDLFDDSPTVNDAIYFCGTQGVSGYAFTSDVDLNIGTALSGSGVELVWEYYGYNYPSGLAWIKIPAANLNDESAGFTLTGSRTVKFPLQLGQYYGTVNGVAGDWVRCRLNAFTSITEGGANTTTPIKTSNGEVEITGYTEASPCTFTLVYNWLLANRPDVGAYHASQWGNLATAPGRVFMFERCVFIVSSPLKSTSETIFMGNGGYNPYQQFSYLQLGEKAGDGYRSPSNLFFSNYNSGQGTAVFNATCKLYGGVIGMWGYTQSGYLTIYSGIDMVGTCIACSVFYSGAVTGTNVRLPGGQFSIPAGGEKVQLFQNATYYMSPFESSVDITDKVLREFKYSQLVPTYNATNWGIISPQNWGSRDKCRLIDWSPKLPNGTDQTTSVVGRTKYSETNLTTILTWDASANTFTTHTTNIPLYGDVGDCIYLRPASTPTYRDMPCYYFTMPGGHSNDYEYIWEYYGGGAWRTLYQFDGTYELTQSGRVWGRMPYGQNSVSINGSTAVWQRIRIITKGTGTPTATSITCQMQAATGLTTAAVGGTPVDWRFSEEYTAAFLISDESGSPIEDVSIKVVDAKGSELTGSPFETDSDGAVTITTVRRRYFFDPLNESGNSGYAEVGYDDYNPYTFIISKQGYETVSLEFTHEEKTAIPLTLKPAIDVMPVIGGKLVIRADPTNSTKDRDLLIGV